MDLARLIYPTDCLLALAFSLLGPIGIASVIITDLVYDGRFHGLMYRNPHKQR